MDLKILTVSGALASLLVAMPGQADTITFDDDVISGGTLSFAGGTASLFGNNLLVDRVFGDNTPLNGGGHACLSCDIDFQTGALLSTSSAFPGSIQYTFAPGGSITVTGGVFDTSTPIATGTTLASGTFTSPISVTVFNGQIALQFGAGTDDKHADLETFFGYDPNDTTWTFGQSAIAAGSVTGGTTLGSAFTGVVTDVDFDNIPEIGNSSVVPVPAAIWLFGSALAGMGTIGGWRRRPAASQAA